MDGSPRYAGCNGNTTFGTWENQKRPYWITWRNIIPRRAWMPEHKCDVLLWEISNGMTINAPHIIKSFKSYVHVKRSLQNRTRTDRKKNLRSRQIGRASCRERVCKYV